MLAGGGASLRASIEGAQHDVETMDDFFFRRRRGDGAVRMPAFNSVRDDLTVGVTFDKFEVTI
jgi:hypothetical protein